MVHSKQTTCSGSSTAWADCPISCCTSLQDFQTKQSGTTNMEQIPSWHDLGINFRAILPENCSAAKYGPYSKFGQIIWRFLAKNKKAKTTDAVLPSRRFLSAIQIAITHKDNNDDRKREISALGFSWDPKEFASFFHKANKEYEYVPFIENIEPTTPVTSQYSQDCWNDNPYMQPVMKLERLQGNIYKKIVRGSADEKALLDDWKNRGCPASMFQAPETPMENIWEKFMMAHTDPSTGNHLDRDKTFRTLTTSRSGSVSIPKNLVGALVNHCDHCQQRISKHNGGTAIGSKRKAIDDEEARPAKTARLSKTPRSMAPRPEVATTVPHTQFQEFPDRATAQQPCENPQALSYNLDGSNESSTSTIAENESSATRAIQDVYAPIVNSYFHTNDAYNRYPALPMFGDFGCNQQLAMDADYDTMGTMPLIQEHPDFDELPRMSQNDTLLPSNASTGERELLFGENLDYNASTGMQGLEYLNNEYLAAAPNDQFNAASNIDYNASTGMQGLEYLNDEYFAAAPNDQFDAASNVNFQPQPAPSSAGLGLVEYQQTWNLENVASLNQNADQSQAATPEDFSSPELSNQMNEPLLDMETFAALLGGAENTVDSAATVSATSSPALVEMGASSEDRGLADDDDTEVNTGLNECEDWVVYDDADDADDEIGTGLNGWEEWVEVHVEKDSFDDSR